VSTHGGNGGLRGDARPRGQLAKANADGLASEGGPNFRLGARFNRGFVGGGVLQQGSQLGRGEVCYCEQMAGAGGGSRVAPRE